MSLSELALLAAYYLSLAVLVAFALHRLWLVAHAGGRLGGVAGRAQRPGTRADAGSAETASALEQALPCVTVQLPLYNEQYVAERLIRSACALDWPRDRLQIQVLDDSTDETRGVVDRTVRRMREAGIDIEAVRRATRTGYKAGALAAGLETARGAWLVVLDADFVPDPGFLRQLAPQLLDPSVDMVQARWAHLNRDFSPLTRAQATLLDGHFVVEQPARFGLGAVFNFNGTAGAWRRSAIERAGGWQHDTITEDLDLSYRARLRGARFVYRDDVAAAGEIPAEIHGLRSQQHRWAKGSVECARKLLPAVLGSRLPLRVRCEAFVHLTANLTYPLLLLVAATLPLLIGVRIRHRIEGSLGLDLALAVAGLGSVIAFYVRSQARLGAGLGVALGRAVAAILLDAGLAVHKTRAVVEALLGHRTPFVRTPKFALVQRTDSWLGNRYVRARLLHGLPELALAAWSVFGVVRSLTAPTPVWGPLPFLMLFAVGFGWIGSLCVLDTLRHTRALVLVARVDELQEAPAASLVAPPSATISETRAPLRRYDEGR